MIWPKPVLSPWQLSCLHQKGSERQKLRWRKLQASRPPARWLRLWRARLSAPVSGFEKQEKVLMRSSARGSEWLHLCTAAHWSRHGQSPSGPRSGPGASLWIMNIAGIFKKKMYLFINSLVDQYLGWRASESPAAELTADGCAEVPDAVLDSSKVTWLQQSHVTFRCN